MTNPDDLRAALDGILRSYDVPNPGEHRVPGWYERLLAKLTALSQPAVSLDVEMDRLAERLEREFVTGTVGGMGASVAGVLRHAAAALREQS